MRQARRAAPIRVAVSSDIRLWADALGLVLSRAPGLQPAGRWGGPPLRPPAADILLLDARMRGVLEACARATRAGDRPRAIVLAAERDGRFALRALESGARGVLGPEATSADLLKAIRVVHEGQIWAGGETVARGLEELAQLCETGRLQDGALACLSARERQVAHQVAAGHANKQVARELAISPGTVKAHLTQIFQKLGLHSRTELAAALGRSLLADPGTESP